MSQGFTKAQIEAFNWLAKHNGDGGFDKHNVLIAGGERGPFMKATWNTLAALGEVEYYHNRRRIRISPNAKIEPRAKS